ncbi:hypothetical protein MSAN_00434200 [Mycena sanguinolenta]|uniref:F-box domain-containing protein n=1 Tax=Mycena sanguinolenta TaxID=230812 RepID=A0A8H7DKB4_9AGAR|nr:hypothetical protein MSAN_00434200 [Mycena sanguinolenta]
MPTRQVFASPISRLPLEVLTEIFTRCVPMSIDYESYYEPENIQTDLVWLILPQVCRLWRNVALNSPAFWSTLVPSHPKSISTFITRAKMAPLVIRVDLDKTDREKLKTILLDHIQQLDTLKLHKRSLKPDLVDFPLGFILWDLTDATNALINTLDFSTVTSLHLIGGETAGMWAVLGQRLQRIQKLHLHHATPSEWLDFLLSHAMYILGLTQWPYEEHGPSFRAEDGSLTHAWAGLECLALHGLYLGQNFEDTSNSPRPTCSEMLQAFLWARREGGARITTLEIKDCWNLSSHDLDHFRLFGDVEYDGKGLEITTREEHESLCSYSIDVLARMLDRDDRCGTEELESE